MVITVTITTLAHPSVNYKMITINIVTTIIILSAPGDDHHQHQHRDNHHHAFPQCSWAARGSRSRSVLRAPASSSLPCPPVQVCCDDNADDDDDDYDYYDYDYDDNDYDQETRRCLANLTCFSHEWRLTG